jgi:hypothetical protein
MPKSKGRKSKKKTSKKFIKKEVVRLNGVEIVRKGRNVFMKSILTPEEREAYIKQIKENHPKVYDEIKILIDEVVTLINQYDKIFVLGGIAAFGYNKMISDSSDDGLSETLIEYCLSIALATPNVNKNNKPTGKILGTINENLIKIRRYFSDYYNFEGATGKHSQIESELRHEMIAETIFMRGEGYMQHIIELYLEMFSGHNDFLNKHYGFTAKDILDTFHKLEESYGCRILMPNGRPHPVQTIKLRNYISKNKISEKDIFSGAYLNGFSKEHPEVIVENNGVILFTLNTIDTYDQLFQIRHFNAIQEKVVKALSMKFGANTSFITPEKFKYEVLNKSEIFNLPIVEEDGNYYLFAMNLPARNLFLLTQSLIERADPQYYKQSFLGNRIQIAKDEFIEQKTLALFKKMLPDVQFYKEAYYNYKNPETKLKCANSVDGRYELDILGISENATYLIEVKAGLVSDASKRGALSSIKTDLTGIIGDAICQSHRASLYIEENENSTFEISTGEVVSPKSKNKIYRISISFSVVGTIISALSKLQQYGIVDENSEFAWAINIYDLMAFTDLVDSEKMFMDYLDKRLPLYNNERLTTTDEMDLLGLYFTKDLKIGNLTKRSDTVQLYEFKKNIDNYFERGGPRPFKKSIK